MELYCILCRQTQNMTDDLSHLNCYVYELGDRGLSLAYSHIASNMSCVMSVLVILFTVFV
jgi:hypothetical protein